MSQRHYICTFPAQRRTKHEPIDAVGLVGVPRMVVHPPRLRSSPNVVLQDAAERAAFKVSRGRRCGVCSDTVFAVVRRTWLHDVSEVQLQTPRTECCRALGTRGSVGHGSDMVQIWFRCGSVHAWNEGHVRICSGTQAHRISARSAVRKRT